MEAVLKRALEGLGNSTVEIVCIQRSTTTKKTKLDPAVVEQRKKLAALLTVVNSDLDEEVYHHAYSLLKSLWNYLNDNSEDDSFGLEDKHRYAISANLCYTAIKSKQNSNFVELIMKSLSYEPCIKFTYYLNIMHNFQEGNFTTVISFVEKILKNKKSMMKTVNVNYHGVDMLDDDNIPELKNVVMFTNLEIFSLFSMIWEEDGKIELKKQKHNSAVFGSVTKKHFQTFLQEFLKTIVNYGINEKVHYADIRKKYSKDSNITKLRELFDNVDKKEIKILINLLHTKPILFKELVSLLPKNSEGREYFENVNLEPNNDDSSDDSGSIVFCNMSMSISEIIETLNLTEEFTEFIKIQEMEKERKHKRQIANKSMNNKTVKKQFRHAQTDTSKLKIVKSKSVQVQQKKKSISTQTDKEKITPKKTLVDEEALNNILDTVVSLKKNVTQKLNNTSIKELEEEIKLQKAKYNMQTHKTEKMCEDLMQIIDVQQKENDLLIKKIETIKKKHISDQNFIQKLRGIKNQHIQEKYTIQMMEYNKRERQCDFIIDYFQSNELIHHTRKYREYWKDEYEKMVTNRTQVMSYFQKPINNRRGNWPSFPTIDMKEFYKFFQDTVIIFKLLNQFRTLENNKMNDNFSNLRLVSGDKSKISLMQYLITHVRQGDDSLDIFRSLSHIIEENNNSDLNYDDILVYVQTYINDIDNSCTICLEEYRENDFYIMKCDHKFHTHCIKQWMKKSKCCPICRQEERNF